jgi:hypothetical protein
LLWQHKLSWSELIAVGALAKVKQKKGDHLMDALTLTSAGISIASIWYPEFRVAVASAVIPYVAPVGAAVAVPVATGVIASAVIGGESGVQDYYEFMTGEVSYEAWKEVVVPAVEQEIMKPVADAGMGALDFLFLEGEKQLKRQFPLISHYVF